MKKRIIFVVVILLFVSVLLVSCKKDPGQVSTIITSSPTKLVFTEEEVNNEYFSFSETNGPSFYFITDKGNLVNSQKDTTTDSNYYKSLLHIPGVVPQIVDNVYTYRGNTTKFFSVASFDNELSFSIYVKPNEPVSNPDKPVLFGYKIKNADSFLVSLGQTIKESDLYETLDIYIVLANGDILTYSSSQTGEFNLKNAFEAKTFVFSDLHDIFNSNKKFLNHAAFETKITYHKGSYELDQTFIGYVNGGEKPIHISDSGFFDWILVIPISWVLQLFSSLVFNSFAFGIVLTTIVVRTIAWPIYAKSNDMTVKMSVAQPEINKLQEKYRLRQDPQSKMQMQQEMAALYKKYKINVFGCVLPLLQMPIFIAMYNSVRKITLEGGMYASKVSNTMFLGIDLAKNVDTWNYVFAALVGVTMFLLTYISSKKPEYSKAVDNNTLKTPQAQQTEKTMKFVSYFMVIMMVVASYNSKSLAFYWIIGNLYSLGQNLLNRKLNEKKHKKLSQDYLGTSVIEAKENKVKFFDRFKKNKNK